VISSAWDHNGGHDGGNVEGWPDCHEFFEDALLCNSVTIFSKSVLDCNSSGIMERIRLVSIIVSLNQEPISRIKRVETMNTVRITLNYSSFIWFHSTNDIVDG